MSWRRKAALGLGVLVTHAGLYAGLTALLRKPPGMARETMAPSMTWVQLLSATPRLPAPEAVATSRPPPARLRDAQPRAAGQAFDAIRSASVAPDHSATQAKTDQPVPAETRPLTAAPVPPAAASQAALSALNLALPRQPAGPPTAAALAARDEHLTPRTTRDERLAQALGTDTRLQESLRGEVLRFQQGRACVDVAPSREAQLNPFNQSVHATPRQARPC